jgi:hypothetical protein
MFGVMHVSAIHGRLLTAWSVAGVLGPLLVNGLRGYQERQGVPLANVYSVILYVMAGLLCVGFVCNLLVRPVSPDRYVAEPAASPASAGGGARSFPVGAAAPARSPDRA